MFQAIQAVIDEHGAVRLLEPIHLSTARCALVVLLEDELAASESEATLLSEAALAVDWNRLEEDAAWSELLK